MGPDTRAQSRKRFFTRPREAFVYLAKYTRRSASEIGLKVTGSRAPGYSAGCDTVDGMISLSQQTKTMHKSYKTAKRPSGVEGYTDRCHRRDRRQTSCLRLVDCPEWGRQCSQRDAPAHVSLRP